MSTVTENDLQRLEDLINSKFDGVDRQFEKLDHKIEKLSDEVNNLKVDLATVKEGQNGINKRLDNLDFIARTVIGGVVLALLAGLAKLLYPNLIN